MGQSLNILSPWRHIRRWVACLAVVLLTSSVFPAYAAQSLQRGPDRVESLTQPIHAGGDVSPLKPRRAGASPIPHSISISPLSQEKRAAETTAVSPPGTPFKIGFGRDIPELGTPADTAARLQWVTTPQGGTIAAISITSPEAVGIRLGILVRRLPPEATLRFYAQGAQSAYEIAGKEALDTIQRNLAAGDGSDDARTYWSPSIEGAEATLEIELPPGIGPETVEIAIPRVSHFFRSPLTGQGGNIVLAIGDAGSCELDATCYSAWTPESNATARMSFVDGGSSYLCSGTLLNDTAASRTPHFLSANHCVSTQTAASTLTTYWFYRSASCDGGTLYPGTRTLTGGATLRYASSTTDTSFMQLLGTPPAGAEFAAWDSTPPALVTAVTGIHHPAGDLQKISFGTLQGFQDCTPPVSGSFSCNSAPQASAEYLDILFTSGTTEGGSSGSGLFKTIGATHYLIGQLYGGSASCSNLSGSHDYGRFDVAYTAALHQWLSPGAGLLLSVSKLGTGSGTVTSAPSGISCGTACSASFVGGTSVTLTAAPAAGSTFTGWSGTCSGTGTCTVVMNAATTVTATFSAVPLYSLAVSKSGTGSGTVTSAPSGINCGTSCSASFASGTRVTLTAAPASGSTFTGWSGACSGTGTSCSVVMTAATSATATFATVSLGVALNNTSLVWTTGGNVPFFVQTAISHSGGYAAQTGRIGNNQSTYLATSVTGPGTLSFYWRISSERVYDVLSVYLDGVRQYSWSGTIAWQQTVLSIPAGTHAVKWEYVKDSNTSSGQDAAWIDDVVFIAACSFTLPSTSVSYTAQETIGAVTINATTGCSWTAASDAPWITITSGGSGTGTGNVLYFVATNTGAQRTGTITIAGRIFAITQAAAPTYLDYVDAVQKIYIGYYQRPADPAGLIYWAEQLRIGGGNLDAIIEAFANSAESLALNGVITGGNISIVINNTYLALLARPADPAGLGFYVTGFNTGQFTAATILLDILNGATSGNDLLSVNDKLTAANLFTRTIDPGLDGVAFQATYAGDADVIKARQFLTPVTWDPLTVPTQAQTTAYIQANISDPGDILAPAAPLGPGSASVTSKIRLPGRQ